MPVRLEARPLLALVLRLLLLALAAVALAGCGNSSGGARATPSTTAPQRSSGVVLASPEQAKQLIDRGGVVLLDVRTPEEFAAGHIAGARNVDFYAADFGRRIDTLDHGARYVVYCHTGNRSGQATALMVGKGFSSVTDVDGGIQAWQAAQLPTVAGV